MKHFRTIFPSFMHTKMAYHQRRMQRFICILPYISFKLKYKNQTFQTLTDDFRMLITTQRKTEKKGSKNISTLKFKSNSNKKNHGKNGTKMKETHKHFIRWEKNNATKVSITNQILSKILNTKLKQTYRNPYISTRSQINTQKPKFIQNPQYPIENSNDNQEKT